MFETLFELLLDQKKLAEKFKHIEEFIKLINAHYGNFTREQQQVFIFFLIYHDLISLFLKDKNKDQLRDFLSLSFLAFQFSQEFVDSVAKINPHFLDVYQKAIGYTAFSLFVTNKSKFVKVLSENPDLIDLIPATLWNQVDQKGLPLFSWLVVNQFSQRLLLKNLNVIPKITSATWNHIFPEGPLKGKSLLYLLCITAEGLQILNEAPQIFDLMSDKSLNEPVISQDQEGCSVLTWIIGVRAGRPLLSKRPSLLERVSEDNWNRVIRSGKYGNATLFFILCLTDSGRNFIVHNPKILDKIRAETWNRPTSSEGREDTPFSLLCSSPEGQQIILRNPQILRFITRETWKKAFEKLTKSKEGDSTFADQLVDLLIGTSDDTNAILALIFRMMIEDRDFYINYDGDGINPVYAATLRNRTEILDVLLNCGFPPNLPCTIKNTNDEGRTGICEAACRDNPSMLKLFLAAGVDPNAALVSGLGDGMTPLTFAILADSAVSIQELIQHGSNLHSPLERGQWAGLSPFGIAYSFSRLTAVAILLENNVDYVSVLKNKPKKSKSARLQKNRACRPLIKKEENNDAAIKEKFDVLLECKTKWVGIDGLFYLAFPNTVLTQAFRGLLEHNKIRTITPTEQKKNTYLFVLVKSEAKRFVQTDPKLIEIENALIVLNAWRKKTTTALQQSLELTPEWLTVDNTLVLNLNPDRDLESYLIHLLETHTSPIGSRLENSMYRLNRAEVTTLVEGSEFESTRSQCQTTLTHYQHFKNALSPIVANQFFRIKGNSVIITALTDRNRMILSEFLNEAKTENVGKNEVQISLDNLNQFNRVRFQDLREHITRCNDVLSNKLFRVQKNVKFRPEGATYFFTDRDAAEDFATHVQKRVNVSESEFSVSLNVEDIKAYLPKRAESPPQKAPVDVSASPTAKKTISPEKIKAIEDIRLSTIADIKPIIDLNFAKRTDYFQRFDVYSETIRKMEKTNDRIKEARKKIQELAQKISDLKKLIQETEEGLERLEKLTVSNNTIKKVKRLFKKITVNATQIPKMELEIFEIFDSLPDEASLTNTRLQSAEESVSEKPESPTPEVQVLSQSPDTLFGKKTHHSQPKSPLQMLEEAGRIESDSECHPGFENMVRVRPKTPSTLEPPKKSGSTSPTPLTPTEVAIQNHLDHIKSLLSSEHKILKNPPALHRALYHHVLQILNALCQEADKNSAAKNLLEGLSHGFFVALNEQNGLLEFCEEFNSRATLSEFNLQRCRLYESYRKEHYFKTQDYSISATEYLARIATEFEQLKTFKSMLEDPLKPLEPVDQTPILHAAQTSLSIIGECGARLFKASALHKACVLWAQIKNLSRKAGYLGSQCQFLVDHLVDFNQAINPYRLSHLHSVTLPSLIKIRGENKPNLLTTEISDLSQTLDRWSEDSFFKILDVAKFINEVCRLLIRNPAKHFDAIEANEDYAQQGLVIDIDTIDPVLIRQELHVASTIDIQTYLLFIQESFNAPKIQDNSFRL